MHKLLKQANCLLVVIGCLVARSLAGQSFSFGAEPTSGFTVVDTVARYRAGAAYGFDLGAPVQLISRSATNRYVTGRQPFYFSVAVPQEGNYRVTVTLGDTEGRSLTTVKAESRRLMLFRVATRKGEINRFSFMVNIRKPRISTGGQVSLKPRELGRLDWDDKLTLEFSDERPCVRAIEITKTDTPVTVYLAGNSTVVNQEEEPWAGWGQMIPRFFGPGVAIANHAESGLSLGSFLASRRLEKIISVIRPGDYLFIEFGHNDQKETGPGDGAYQSYTERLRTFIATARAHGGQPVLVTSTARRSFDSSGRSVNTLGDYPEAARLVARQEQVPLLDLNRLTTTLYDALGVDGSKKALVHYPANTFPGQDKPLADNTHFNPYGAYELARCIVQEIKRNKLGLAGYLVQTPAFDPARPDPADAFYWPPSPALSIRRPDGN
ncbi:rhamnogalacturonan acetylesterase [Spirosoma luteolum]